MSIPSTVILITTKSYWGLPWAVFPIDDVAQLLFPTNWFEPNPILLLLWLLCVEPEADNLCFGPGIELLLLLLLLVGPLLPNVSLEKTYWIWIKWIKWIKWLTEFNDSVSHRCTRRSVVHFWKFKYSNQYNCIELNWTELNRSLV